MSSSTHQREGIFALGEVVLHPRVQRAKRGVVLLRQHHRHAHRLPVHRIVQGERAYVANVLETLRNGVHVGRVDLHAAHVDLVALAAAQHQPPALVDQADVAGREPALDHGRGREIVAAEVASSAPAY